MFIDTHCHLDDEKLSDKKLVFGLMERDNVSFAINMGCNLTSSVQGQMLSKEYERIYFAAGYHPSDAKDLTSQTLLGIEGLLTDKKCVAVGEIGLDYYWDKSYCDTQKQAFITQIALADKYDLPISVHCREATMDTLEILKTHTPKNGGVMHCFSGSVETAKILLDLGFYISFGGTLTFKNAKNVQEVAKNIPLDRILTETDSPYLAPTPLRGSVNMPSNVSLVTAFLAGLRGISVENTAKTVMENARRLFKKLV
ncbi:MAG: TatD family deoxyribonuclease [Clostridiales bacterium]|nr:TatD family deoxyribonuclease [Clostridiales bacterium]